MSALRASDPLRLTIHEAGKARAEISFDKARVTIGSQSSCDVVLEHRGVRRIHATLLRTHGVGYSLIDGAGQGGTLLNGTPVSSADLHAGDEIEIGPYRIYITGGLPDAVIADADILAESEVPKAEAPKAKVVEAPKLKDMVLVPDVDGGLSPAPAAQVLWAATADEMASAPRTGEVDVSSIDGLLQPGGEEDEPVFLLTVKKSKPGSPRRIRERTSKKPRS